MTSMEEYFPVPTISRDVNSLPPRTRLVSYMTLASPHRTDDLHLVAFGQRDRRVSALGRDVAVDGNRGVLALDAEQSEQAVHCGPGRDLHRLAVDADRDRHERPRPFLPGAAVWITVSP